MPSKQVTDRQKSADSIIAAVDTHAPVVATALANLLAPHLREGESLPDGALFLSLVARALGAEKQRLVDADEAHEAELADDEPRRKSRDDAAEALRQEVIDLREVLTGMYGGAFAAKIVPGTTPRDPVVLARFAQAIEKNLDAAALPKSRIKGAKLDKVETLAALGALRQTLEQALLAVVREAREAQVTQVRKDQTMDGFDGMFSASAMVVSGALRLAGMHELSAKLRPSARKPGHTASEAGEESAEAGAQASP